MKSRIFHWIVFALAVAVCAMAIVHAFVGSTATTVVFLVMVVLFIVLVIPAKRCPNCGAFSSGIAPWQKELGYCRKCGKKIEYDS